MLTGRCAIHNFKAFLFERFRLCTSLTIFSIKTVSFLFYRERDIRYDSDADFPGRYIDIAKLISYEMARQIFVGLVSNLKTDLWINELLASFYGYYILLQVLYIIKMN